jgi:predicted RNase H-like nuclease (RuvC/YqgF family)
VRDQKVTNVIRLAALESKVYELEADRATMVLEIKELQSLVSNLRAETARLRDTMALGGPF